VVAGKRAAASFQRRSGPTPADGTERAEEASATLPRRQLRAAFFFFCRGDVG